MFSKSQMLGVEMVLSLPSPVAFATSWSSVLKCKSCTSTINHKNLLPAGEATSVGRKGVREKSQLTN